MDLTLEIKQKILGENIARLYGIDIAAQTAKLSHGRADRRTVTGVLPAAVPR